ncbi:Uncharacterized conserved protein YibQ, putative polysaccharide deacetylase 2 family [Yoonia tamlensis]|uniref:Uncharacterized conserved protein YibQ, putative polysaccharide deacetylase 2 family n=1 Tax=Yoonia tamlensis TaxID=390270 RepID=A0A1I6G604_9RHOB|nr:divergent polysaccharide deacetylase family protein [Yoonia tamlensis]SFR37614.1 Uncharacterized conserved protein YibQ, putative polysaccharide deacetylase 2 family [Yoonia tamlensis]
MRGSLRGGIWALGLSSVTLGAVSLVNEQPAGNMPPQVPLVSAPAAVAAAPDSSLTRTDPTAVAREYVADAPRLAAPDAETALPQADTDTATAPQTPAQEPAHDTPVVDDESTMIVTLLEPALDTIAAAPPHIPQPEAPAVITTRPAAPRAEQLNTAAPVVAGLAEDALVVVVPAQDATPTPQVAEIASAQPAITPQIRPQATPQQEPTVVAQTPAPVIVSPAPSNPASDAQTAAGAAPAAAQSGESRVLRLGGSSGLIAPPAIATEPPEREPQAQQALVRFGTAFENPAQLPLLAVLLVDDGTQQVAADEIAALGMPVTVVLHALDPNLRDRMAAYRAAGIEIAVQASLPTGAVPTDIEVAFEAVFGLMPEAAILYADGSGVLRNNRAATEQVMQILAADGRGLVTAPQGLGGALQAAQAAGVPAIAAIRNIDSAGEPADAIKRGLDQAGLRARQTGNVVLHGQLQASTLGALAEWAVTVNQSQLALAPVSAVLREVQP